MRSETIHQGLSGAELEITDGFEIEVHSSDGGFDFEGFQHARAAATMPARQRRPPENREPSSVTAEWPELTGIDSALVVSLGFGLDALLSVPDALATWPVENWEPVGTATADEICEYVTANLAVDIDPGHLRAAVEWMTVTASGLESDLKGDLTEHWELDRREHRLTVRPLVPRVDGRLLVLPWAAGGARRILIGSVMDGRLPWPETALPRPASGRRRTTGRIGTGSSKQRRWRPFMRTALARSET